MSYPLNLTLKKKWFDMIASGEKREEYREIKWYWAVRLFDFSLMPIEQPEELKTAPHNLVYDLLSGHKWEEVLAAYWTQNKGFESVIAKNGYGPFVPEIIWEHKGIRVGKPNPNWCEPENVDKLFFILDIGEVTRR